MRSDNGKGYTSGARGVRLILSRNDQRVAFSAFFSLVLACPLFAEGPRFTFANIAVLAES